MIIFADQIAVPAEMIISLLLIDAVMATLGVFVISLLARLVEYDEPLPGFIWTWFMLATPFMANHLYVTALSTYPDLLSQSAGIKAASIFLVEMITLLAIFRQALLTAQQKGI